MFDDHNLKEYKIKIKLKNCDLNIPRDFAINLLLILYLLDNN